MTTVPQRVTAINADGPDAGQTAVKTAFSQWLGDVVLTGKRTMEAER